ncbi:MAG: efflux RND transporter periplasmic adaptor subunit [Cypionkella sp.]|uniref:efflux RND transporter periplasmic adaptor subunit n=1 Tax=Cypionkella sp. TaxID=2811411 RepID=UPI002ABA8324|nr:efflux RND transporter periplasmic adaptor subunit [Cypionkella sp.]MDZ4310541.1 efflux RND transporter periplasmic adaptor subunit [Cypionkella sp.]MDZ4395106.1 efflux RND transporter periplasmic adaptor subunit [Cypionkella sp.]
MSFFTAHRVTALVVLVAASAWVLTGEFSAVGSQELNKDEAAPEAQAEPAQAVATQRTVAAVAPVFIDYAREIRISGATQADKQAVLAARTAGIVQELGVTQGGAIAADALVVRLEGAEIQAGVDTAVAALEQATETLTVGQALYDKGSLPELELTARRSAKAAAEAGLSQAKAAEDRLLLKAPFAGTVDTVEVELGEWVQAGTAIATILALDPIVVKAEVSERDVAFVSIGSKAKVRLVDGAEMEGVVRHVAQQASTKTRTFGVEVALPNAAHKIPAGMTAEVRLFTATQPAVVVPRSIITINEEGVIGLRVVGADSKAAFAPVTVIDDGEAGMVVTGVPKDKKVIVAGQDLVTDGDVVTVSELTPAQAAEALK